MPNAATLRTWLRALVGPSFVWRATSTWPLGSRWATITPPRWPSWSIWLATAASAWTSTRYGLFQCARSAPGGGMLSNVSATETARWASSASAETTAMRVTVCRSR